MTNPDPALVAAREANMKRLVAAGFAPATWLPMREGREAVRPPREIAERLAALVALFFWVVAPADQMPDEALIARLDRDDLRAALTEHERSILALPRARAARDLAAAIGWHLEQMWALAWTLGLAAEPTFDGVMITDDTVEQVLDFVSGKLGVDALVTRAEPRSAAEVAALEDLFYCAHNAVRSAQLGEQTVPAGFDPRVNGGVVHERRHALSWAMSPGVGWDETDLST